MTTSMTDPAADPTSRHLRATSGPRTTIPLRGPFDLAEIATMGFGHRDEAAFDGVMRLGFCLDGDLDRPVGVAVRQSGDTLELELTPAAGPDGQVTALSDDELDRAVAQTARVVSADHDGAAFDALCRADRVLAPVHAVAPGFRPANFYSPYEALVWSVLSARRARAQGIGLRARLAQAHGAVVEVAGVPTPIVPGPSVLATLEAFPGLPPDRIPRLHAIAAAARSGALDLDRLRSMGPEEAMTDLQRLPGIGPFYSALVVIRACGHADVVSLAEDHTREAVRERYGLDHEPSDAELLALADGWRPFRTWVMVMLRALGGRIGSDRPSR